MVTDYRGHYQTLLPAWEINLKACAPGSWTRNLPAGPGIERGSSDRQFWSGVHCDSVTWATAAGHLHSLFQANNQFLSYVVSEFLLKAMWNYNILSQFSLSSPSPKWPLLCWVEWDVKP